MRRHPLKWMLFSAVNHRLSRVVSQLPGRRFAIYYRAPNVRRLVEGMTGPEIAARTGLTPESVRVNLCRGTKLLRALLEGEDRL